MTWKERRVVTILSIILAILSAALLIVLGIRYRSARPGAGDQDGQAVSALAGAQVEYTALTYDNGSATLSFSLGEDGGWVWSDDPDFPLDDSVVREIVAELSALKPQQTLTEDLQPLEEYGLDNPRATLTASTNAGTATTLALGNATTDGSSYYMMMNEDPSTLYIIPGVLYARMCTAIYDMMILPKLPELAADAIAAITIRGADREDGAAGAITALIAQPSGGGTVWRSGGADVTGSETVQALLEDLSSLAFARCVDYRPSDEAVAICGLDAPQAVLTVVYATEGGAESTLVLTVGLPAAGGEGRYVRLGEDETIYLLSTALLDPLMRVSVNGLSD